MNWDLIKPYEDFDVPEFGEDMKKLNSEIAAVREMIANLSEENEAAQLREIILRKGEIVDLMGRLGNRMQLKLSADSDCEATPSPIVLMGLFMELEDKLSRLENELSCCIGANPRIDALCEADEVLAEHKPYFRNCREKHARLMFRLFQQPY